MKLVSPVYCRLMFVALAAVILSGCATQHVYDPNYIPTYEHELIANIEARRHSAMYDAAQYDRDQMRIVGQRYRTGVLHEIESAQRSRYRSGEYRAIIYDSTLTTGVYTTYPYYSPGYVNFSSGRHLGGYYNSYGHGGLHFNSHNSHGGFHSGGTHIHGSFGGNPNVQFNFGSHGGGLHCP